MKKSFAELYRAEQALKGYVFSHLLVAETGKVVQIYTGHTEPVFTVAWSPDGKSLASGSADSTAQIWDASTGKQRFSSYRGHRVDVSSIAWSPDGTRMVTGSMDTTVQVWKVTDGLSFGL